VRHWVSIRRHRWRWWPGLSRDPLGAAARRSIRSVSCPRAASLTTGATLIAFTNGFVGPGAGTTGSVLLYRLRLCWLLADWEEMVTPSGRYLIIDLGSRNGTFVNGTRVNRAELNENDIVAIGHATFRLAGGELIEYVDDGRASLRAGTVGGASGHRLSALKGPSPRPGGPCPLPMRRIPARGDVRAGLGDLPDNGSVDPKVLVDRQVTERPDLPHATSG
jgi:FHA domain